MLSIESKTSNTSPKRVRLLLLEDRLGDAELIVHRLQQSGYDPEWQRVETEKEFHRHLDASIDIILADYNLPGFDGLTALKALQQSKLDIPFVIVSGSLGAELVARCIKEGVTDYLMKDRLERLGLAVANALEERRLRSEHALVQQQLRQSQKMEAIGQLAGGIAHDFNNVLTVINGWSGMLLEDRGVSDQTREAAKQIYTAGQRASSLTRQLLYFSRKRPLEQVSLDLNHTIEEVSTMLRRLIGENINLVLDLAPAVGRVEADASMMEQVLVNLTVNSRDAMPQGGKLTITTQVVEIVESDLRTPSLARAGRFVALRVHDTGCGISTENLPRIFEPFFTTKEAGKGTGLGLATVFGIAKQHEGWLEVNSTIGIGTCFSLFLPAATANQRSAPKIDAPSARFPICGGAETILIVEDEASVREFAVAVLEPLGYRVLQARSGHEAIEVWKWHNKRISLLLTDMVLPDDLTGPELARQLLAAKPELRIIFTSGYSQETADQVFAAEKGARFINKPYSPRQLGSLVRKTLDSHPVPRSSGRTVS